LYLENSIEKRPLIVLAGGLGTRLQSVLKGAPKPLADVNGVPFLQLLFVKWREAGFTKFILSLHYEASRIIELINELKDTVLVDCEMEIVVETNPLGTGGAISFVVRELNLNGDIFIVNADTWIDSGFNLIQSREGNCIGIVRVQNTNRYGRVLLDDSSRVVCFEEKLEDCEPGFINAGIYKLSAELFRNWDGMSCSLERDFLPKLVANSMLCGVELSTKFIDIGIPEDYYKFCSWKMD
jgi:NDP-sugar pyrophosphorylase family protein